MSDTGIKIWVCGKKIGISPRYAQLMADCLVMWQAGETNPDEEDNAKDFRDEILSDLINIKEIEDESDSY